MENFNGLYNTDSFSDRFSSKAKDRLRRTFKRNTSYREVIKYNSDGTTVANFPIQISNSSNRQNKYKNFIAHPDYPVDYGDTFDIGDAIVIVTEINENNKISDDGLMWQCNDTLKWKHNGEVFTQDCFIDGKAYSTNNTEDIRIVNSKVELYTQMTDNLKNIDINQDFIFGNYFKRVYKLIAIDDSTKDGLAVMTMELGQSSDNDNLEDNIADNPNIDSDTIVIESTIDDSYYTVKPATSEIKVGTTVLFETRHYDSSNNEILSEFDYNVLNITPADYELVEVDNNNVSIKAIGDSGSGQLEITNTDYVESFTVDITLTGLW